MTTYHIMLGSESTYWGEDDIIDYLEQFGEVKKLYESSNRIANWWVASSNAVALVRLSPDCRIGWWSPYHSRDVKICFVRLAEFLRGGAG